MIYSPAYVVGYGMIDGLGNNPTDCFRHMIDDQDYSIDLDFMLEQKLPIYRGIRVDDETLQLPDGFNSKLLKTMTRTEKFALHATEQAFRMSGLPKSANVAVIFSSVSNETECLEDTFIPLHENRRVNPLRMVNRIVDIAAAHICSHYGFMGTSYALSASCSTGMLSIDCAMRLCDEYDYVIVGSGDASTMRIPMKYFNSIKALGNHNMPFDDNREGFMMGEGAGVLILQSGKKTQAYKSTPYAKLYPVGSASDAFDLTNPAEDGRGAKLAISKAMKYSGMKRIDAISAHATSTPIGDPLEYKVITEYFKNTPIYAPKSKIGHTLAGSGILETIYAIQSMRNSIIPHCQNLKTCSFDEYNCLVREPIQKPLKRTLNNTFGFGGKCASQVIEYLKW
jgi:3-oxoacyl-[acyl-carrier-protein] synthase II